MQHITHVSNSLLICTMTIPPNAIYYTWLYFLHCNVMHTAVNRCTLSRKTAERSNLSTFCFHELIHKDLDLASRPNVFINHPKMLHISKQRKSFAWKTFKRKPSQKNKTDEFWENFQTASPHFWTTCNFAVFACRQIQTLSCRKNFDSKMTHHIPRNWSKNPSVIWH